MFINVHQQNYVESVQINLEEKRICSLTDAESHQLQAFAGQLNWIAGLTRPDIAFNACQTSVSVKKATITDLF